MNNDKIMKLNKDLDVNYSIYITFLLIIITYIFL